MKSLKWNAFQEAMTGVQATSLRSTLDTTGRKEQKSNMIIQHPGTGGVSAARANLTRAGFRCAVPRAKHG